MVAPFVSSGEDATERVSGDAVSLRKSKNG
jgi:hypothetical protein